jgi:hypothetical protein
MNESDECHISVSLGPAGWHPPDLFKRLSAQGKCENSNRDIDTAEREVALILQGIGKWPKFAVDDRMEGLFSVWGFFLDLNSPVRECVQSLWW